MQRGHAPHHSRICTRILPLMPSPFLTALILVAATLVAQSAGAQPPCTAKSDFLVRSDPTLAPLRADGLFDGHANAAGVLVAAAKRKQHVLGDAHPARRQGGNAHHLEELAPLGQAAPRGRL
jgi:hypothetical protein